MKIDAIAAAEVIDNWLMHEPQYLWSRAPQEIILELFDKMDDEGNILYNDAEIILHSAKVVENKEALYANHGMRFIRNKWKLLTVKEKENE